MRYGASLFLSWTQPHSFFFFFLYHVCTNKERQKRKKLSNSMPCFVFFSLLPFHVTNAVIREKRNHGILFVGLSLQKILGLFLSVDNICICSIQCLRYKHKEPVFCVLVILKNLFSYCERRILSTERIKDDPIDWTSFASTAAYANSLAGWSSCESCCYH